LLTEESTTFRFGVEGGQSPSDGDRLNRVELSHSRKRPGTAGPGASVTFRLRPVSGAHCALLDVPEGMSC
jgi:hypothetical protein